LAIKAADAIERLKRERDEARAAFAEHLALDGRKLVLENGVYRTAAKRE
jgi:hypothetical protein